MKAHIGIDGNKAADALAKAGAESANPKDPVITEGGLQQEWKKLRKQEREVRGMGMGRIVKWKRRARINYVQCRTGKGKLQSWRARRPDMPKCGRDVEIGKHIALVCTRGGDRKKVEHMGRYGWREVAEESEGRGGKIHNRFG